MRGIVQYSLKQPVFILLGTLIFIVGGVIAFLNLPVEAFPDVSDTQVNVIALFPGRAAEEVERQVTIPIETALNSTPNVARMFSHTQFGLSYTILTFNDKPTDQIVRQQVIERLRGVDLPAGVSPEIAPLSTAIGEIFRFRLRGDGYTPQQLRTLQDWVVERQLRQVQGVADVVTQGGTIKQYEVNPDLAKMRDYKLTLNQLVSALQRANSNAGGGAVTQGRQQFLVRSLGSFRTSVDIAQVVVAVNLSDEFFTYAMQVQKNAKAMAASFVKRGYNIISGGTDNHMMLIDLRNKGISGKDAETALGKAEITVNKNMVPFDDKSPFVTSGIRVGTPAITTRGMMEDDMETIVDLIDRVLSNATNDGLLEEIADEVNDMMSERAIFVY